MAFITVGRENTTDINLYYEDLGRGPVVVLLSGWPLDSRSWEPQTHALLAAGYRVVAFDRRGFGQSSRPTTGYDFDTLAADLSTLLTELDLQDVTLIGFSLGTGEVARYIGKYGTGRLKSCVFIESLAPSFTKSGENPNGVDQATIDTIRQAIIDDRPAWLTGLLADFLNLDDYLGKRVSEETVRNSWNAGAGASPWATWACVLTWLDDFHEDIKRIDIPCRIRGRPARHVPQPRQGSQPRAPGLPGQRRSDQRVGLNRGADTSGRAAAAGRRADQQAQAHRTPAQAILDTRAGDRPGAHRDPMRGGVRLAHPPR
jgi:pimeloyl-ACP methyl ester carboxylesterase